MGSPEPRQARRLRGALRGVALVAATAAGPAEAHGAFGDAAPFWSGALHVAVSPLALAAVVGLGAATAFAANDLVLRAATISAMTGGLAAWLLPAPLAWVAPLGALLAGAAAVLAYEPTPRSLPWIAAGAGLAVGAGTNLDERSWAAGLGVAAATLVATIWIVEVLSRTRTRLPIARRILGAWVVAIAMLLAALELRGTALVPG